MTGRGLIGRGGAVGALLVAVAVVAGPAGAQQRGRGRDDGQRLLFEWRGKVDKEMHISMRGSRPTVAQVGDNERGTGRVETATTLPRRPGRVVVERVDGRGAVDVIQQPSARNGYVAVVRLRDPSSGSATYDVRAYWQPTGGYARGDDRYDDGRYDGRRGRDDRDERRERSNEGRRARPRY